MPVEDSGQRPLASGLTAMTDPIIEGAEFATVVSSASKEAFIRKIAEITLRRDSLSRDQLQATVRAMMGREELGSTGTGLGFANPHTRTPYIKQIRTSWAIVDPPLEFDSLDGLPVKLVSCMVSPQNQPGDHLRALGDIRDVRCEIEKALSGIGLSPFDLDYPSLVKVLDSLRTWRRDQDWPQLDLSELRVDPMVDLHYLTAELRTHIDNGKFYKSTDQSYQQEKEMMKADDAKRRLRECLHERTRTLIDGLYHSLDVELSLEEITIRARAVEPAVCPNILRALRALPPLVGFRTTLHVS